MRPSASAPLTLPYALSLLWSQRTDTWLEARGERLLGIRSLKTSKGSMSCKDGSQSGGASNGDQPQALNFHHHLVVPDVATLTVQF
ncbi:hypothetical protein L596_001194 [Steinernema carpocapsae]|uniref:Uncharacterized protein n=1 Tax=Steinernema carpocapsae TaxID=34508 RepID=A0A4U8UKW0_STECR|nr:hypothetical protein L596_001194 [Steinernema carpocapsae]